jgi:hypothetical protein
VVITAETMIEKPKSSDLKLNNKFYLPSSPEFSKYSRITLEDFTSGRLLELERKWLEENPFPKNTVPIINLSLNDSIVYDYQYSEPEKTRWEMGIKVVLINPYKQNYSDPIKRPLKIISYYVLWDEVLFGKLGFDDQTFNANKMFGISKEEKYYELGLMSWAWLNPDNSITIGHSLINMASMYLRSDLVLMPLVDMYEYFEKRAGDQRISEYKSLMQIYTLYPNLKPLGLAEKWVESKIMPKELENCLLGVANIFSPWS